MSEMCHLYSVTCHIVYIVKSYSKSFSFHHLSQKHTKKIEKIEKMLLRIHPPNQGYLKAHSLYSNHFFRLVCSIAITTQKKNHIIECTLPLHVIYLFSHQYMCSCFCGLASILAEDIKPRASCTEEVLGYAHISIKGLSSVSVLLRASVFTECCRGTAAELKGSFAVSSH